MVNNYRGVEDTAAFSTLVNSLRAFCLARGFREVSTQDRLSILAACEDPDTVATFDYMGETWPLPQTGQMWLEYELLTNPQLPGVFCVGTSYRNEPDPVPGRHRLIFPMFEFELPGTQDDLQTFEIELLEQLGFGAKGDFHYKTYDELKKFYQVDELTHEHENAMETDFGPVVFCGSFPEYTSPFWNMRREESGAEQGGEVSGGRTAAAAGGAKSAERAEPTHARKIDVIMHGHETIGSAERSIDPADMRQRFYTISEGRYAEKLFGLFGRQRVQKELDEFLSLPLFERVGGGIGMTRLVSAARRHGLLDSAYGPAVKPVAKRAAKAAKPATAAAEPAAAAPRAGRSATQSRARAGQTPTGIAGTR